MLWDVLRDRRDAFNGACTVLLLAVGFGACRRWLSLSLGDLVTSVWSASPNLQLIASLTSVLCFAVVVMLTRQLSPVLKRGAWVFGFALLLGSGTVMMIMTEEPILCYVGIAVSQLGFASMYAVWMELYGCFEPAKMALAYELSTLINGLVWGLFQQLENLALLFAYIAVPLLSVLSLLALEANMSSSHVPVEGAAVPARPLWKLVVWVGAFGFAFGAGDAVTGMAISSTASYVGRALPSFVIVAGLLLAPRTFDIHLLYRASVLFVMFGFAAAFLQTGFSQVLLSASLESCTVLGFITICGAAYHGRASAAPVSAFLFAVQEAAVQLGKLAYGALTGAGATGGTHSIVVGAGMVALVLVAYLFFFNERVFSQAWGIRALSPQSGGVQAANQEPGSRQSELDALCTRCGVSPQERNVLMLMAEGMSVQEISDELFIAQGTVRSHISRIYGKLGIHSRKEFDRLVGADSGNR